MKWLLSPGPVTPGFLISGEGVSGREAQMRIGLDQGKAKRLKAPLGQSEAREIQLLKAPFILFSTHVGVGAFVGLAMRLQHGAPGWPTPDPPAGGGRAAVQGETTFLWVLQAPCCWTSGAGLMAHVHKPLEPSRNCLIAHVHNPISPASDFVVAFADPRRWGGCVSRRIVGSAEA